MHDLYKYKLILHPNKQMQAMRAVSHRSISRKIINQENAMKMLRSRWFSIFIPHANHPNRQIAQI